MKKFTKLSLVAAVAVAGLSSANAQALEEAIKNVDVSGSVVYRYDEKKNDNNEHADRNNNYKIGLNLSSKVNDYVKFNSRFIVGEADGGFKSLDAGKNGDGQADVSLSNAYFGVTAIPNTTVNVGKQGLTTPWTVAIDSDGNEQTGTGILALSTFGQVSVAAAYFNQTNLQNSGDAKVEGKSVKSLFKGNEDIATLGVIGNFDVVNVDAWYLDMADTFKTYTIGAKSDIKFDGGKIGVEARYVSLELDKQYNSDSEKDSLVKLVVSGNVGIVNAKLAYAVTGKDGGLTALDNDASSTLLGWNLNANGKADAKYYQVAIGANILDNLNLTLNYGKIEYTDWDNNGAEVDMEEEETYAQLTYKMSKNLSTYLRYGQMSKNDLDYNRGRLQVEYKF